MIDLRGIRVSPKGWLIVAVAVAVVTICVYGLVRMTGGNTGAVNTVGGGPEEGATRAAPTPSPASTPAKKEEKPSPSPSPSATPTCAAPGALFNVKGEDVDTLLPDCGVAVVPAKAKDPLGLGCGGKYPTIMYKTTTTKSKTTICGTNSSGEDVRMVTRPSGGRALDLDSAYDPGLDSFVSRHAGSTYTVEAYNGSLTVKRDGKSDRQDSSDWISLDNESDYD